MWMVKLLVKEPQFTPEPADNLDVKLVDVTQNLDGTTDGGRPDIFLSTAR